MKPSLRSAGLAGCLALVPSLDAGASCAEERTCFAVTGQVAHCSARKVEGQRLVRLELADVQVAQAPCGVAIRGEPEPMEDIARRIDRLGSYKVFYAGSDESCRTLIDRPFAGGVRSPCCDVVPATGLCRLDAPLLVPKGAGRVNPLQQD